MTAPKLIITGLGVLWMLYTMEVGATVVSTNFVLLPKYIPSTLSVSIFTAYLLRFHCPSKDEIH